MMTSDIDFVLLWVDDNDPEWQRAYRLAKGCDPGGAEALRFRDWGLLRYWFRGVERFAPWVNRIFFITVGHLPQWLDCRHPKLRVVKHTDYIPADYLPTFNSNTIELNLHRLDDLGERFVLFNDDILLTSTVAPERFFSRGLPRDMAVLNALQPERNMMSHVAVNNIALLNTLFDARKTVKEHPTKWWSPRYGLYLVRNLFLSRYPRFTGFVDPHMPQPYLKSTFSEGWLDFGDELDATCRTPFRTPENVNHWLLRYCQMARGLFEPLDVMADTKIFYSLTDRNFDCAVNTVARGKKAMVCLNDGPVSDFSLCRSRLVDAFQTLLPKKSAFELDSM